MKIFSIRVSYFILFVLFTISIISAQWQKTNGIKGGYFSQVAGDANNIIAITNYGSVFHFNNDKWTFQSSYAYFNKLYKLQNKWVGIYYNDVSISTDDGITWNEILKPSNTNFLTDTKVIDGKIYAIATDTLFVSEDAGTTWNIYELNTTVIANQDTGFFYGMSTFHVKDDILIIDAFTTLPLNFSALLYSTDFGKTWKVTDLPSSSFIQEITADENNFYASTSTGFYKTDNNFNWKEINNGLSFPGISISTSELDFYNGELIAVINNDPSGIYKYNGSAWEAFYTESYPASVSTTNETLLFCTNGDVKKYNGNNNWETLTSEIIASTSRPITLSNSSVFSIYKKVLYRTTDEGVNWENIKDNFSSLLPINGDTLLCIASGEIQRSNNNGTDWEIVSLNVPSAYAVKLSSIGRRNSQLFAGFFGVRPRTHLPAVWEQGGIYTSLDNGNTWTKLNSGLPTEGGVPVPVSSIISKDDVVILDTYEGKYSLVNNSWVNISSSGFPANTYINTITIFKGDIYFKTNNGLFISTDKGITKQELNTGLPSYQYYQVELFIYEDGMYFLNNEDLGSVYKLKGNEWVETEFTLPQNIRFTSLQSSGKLLYAGTYDNGIWKYNPSITSVDDESLSPGSFSLSQNYPNPFNPVTTIKYSVGGSGSQVHLKIYNALGKEVQTLVNENKPAGVYDVTFNASNLPSGIYFYRIITNSFSETKKMILVK